MNENEIENNDSENVENEEVQDDVQEDTQDEDTQEEVENEEDDSIEEIKARLAQLEKENKTLKIQKLKSKVKKPEAKAESTELTQHDLYALMANKVHEDDIDEVVAYARLKNIPVKDALKSNVVKTILRESEEVRQTASVSNTKTSRKAPQERTADQILQKIQKGELPDNPEDMVKAFEKIQGISR